MRRLFTTILLLVLVSLSGCKFQKLRKSDDYEAKYQAAQEYMDEGDCYKAQILLEETLPLLRGSSFAEDGLFLLAESYFCQGLFVLSAARYMTFYRTYGRSDKVEEALYKEALSYYMQSPKYSLDQAETYNAINKAQNYLNRFPYGKYREEANEIIDELREKLERKAFEVAREYYNIRLYKSAVVAFESFARDYPDSDLREEAAYLMLDAQFTYAEMSVRNQQRQRYREVVDYYIDFIDRYTESAYLRRAEDIYSKTLERLEDLNQEDQGKAPGIETTSIETKQ